MSEPLDQLDDTAPEVVVEPTVNPDPPPPTAEEIQLAQAAEAKADAERPVSQQLQDILQQLRNYKAFAVAKADGVVDKIVKVGGEVPGSLQEVLDTIHAESK